MTKAAYFTSRAVERGVSPYSEATHFITLGIDDLSATAIRGESLVLGVEITYRDDINSQSHSRTLYRLLFLADGVQEHASSTYKSSARNAGLA